MKVIRVEASKAYDVIIGGGLLDRAGEHIRKLTRARTVAVITDDVVDGLYAERLEKSLKASGFGVVKYVFPHGEGSKNAETYVSILEFLAGNYLTRTDIVVALGGGVVGDVAGFAAASYMRGVGLVQIPTTLLAAVDSSVGGKTGIDLRAGKNLAGAFYQPDLVLCDCDCLSTLTPEVYRDGCAEVIKYGVISGRALFDRLREPVSADYEEIIARCVEIKRDIVNADERETGVRRLLNFGHTVGHAVEKLSDYAVSHGAAVGVGMAVIARSAARMGLCPDACRDEIVEMLGRHGLGTSCEYSAEALARVCQNDKKVSGDVITLIVPEDIGLCKPHEIPIRELCGFLRLGIEE